MSVLDRVDECDVRSWSSDLHYDVWGYVSPFNRGWARVTEDDIAGATLAPGVDFLYVPSATPVLEPDEVVHDTTPDLLTLLSRKEPLMLAAAPEPMLVGAAVHDEAPFGHKADGTPRKRPAPSPERVALMRAGRGKVTAVVHVTNVPLLDRIVADLDAEIARLTTARDALIGVAA